MQFLRAFAGTIDGLNQRLGSVLRWLALLMVLMGAYNAVARYLTPMTMDRFGFPLASNALNEAQWYLFSLIFLLGAAYGLKVDAHVRVDVLFGRLSARARGWIDLLGTVFFLLPFTGVMLWVSYPWVQRSLATMEVSPDPGGLPRWPIKAVVLVAFGLLLLQALAHLVRSVDKIRGVDDGTPVEPDPFAEPGTEHSAGGHL